MMFFKVPRWAKVYRSLMQLATTLSLPVEGMPAPVVSGGDALKAVPGVLDVSVNLATSSAHV
jgi:hypothetical protein